MTLPTYSVLLSALMLACGAPSADELKPIPPVRLFTYPAGPTRDLLADVPCGEGHDTGCIAGFAAIGSNEQIYFYDANYNNIKVLDLRSGRLLRLIEGPEELPIPDGVFRGGWPEDMSVALDGSMYLLVLGGEGKNNVYRIFRRTPADTRWTVLAEVAGRYLGIPFPTGGACDLETGPDGTPYVHVNYSNSRRGIEKKGSIPLPTLATLASQGNLSAAWDYAIQGTVGGDGLFYETDWMAGEKAGPGAKVKLVVRSPTGESIGTITDLLGDLLGVTRDGNLVLQRWGTFACVDPEGKTRAIWERPARGSTKDIVGHGRTLISPEGRAYYLLFSQDGLEVYAFGGGR
jgi:hypothetical protein